VRKEYEDTQSSNLIGMAIVVCVWLPCCLAIIAIPAFILYRIKFWLQNGYWFSYTILDFLNYEEIDLGIYKITWVGVHKVCLWGLQLPFEVGLGFVIFILGGLFAVLSNYLDVK
jgi:ABC-type glycerol-3-phosphate transport system permease component